MGSHRFRRFMAVLFLLLLAAIPLTEIPFDYPTLRELIENSSSRAPAPVTGELTSLDVKGRAPKTGYARSQFGNGWESSTGCDTRNRVLARDLTNVILLDDCKVQTGTLLDPYTGNSIAFVRGETTSDDVQIDHVVALSNAWQTGAQQLSYEVRAMFANDPLNLLAVDGPTNEKKSDSDAASWLPPNKTFRCSYVKRQIAVKVKYSLWVTQAERDAMARQLLNC